MFQGTGKWYEMQDLHVIDILPQMITLSESYIQVSWLCHSLLVGKFIKLVCQRMISEGRLQCCSVIFGSFVRLVCQRLTFR